MRLQNYGLRRIETVALDRFFADDTEVLPTSCQQTVAATVTYTANVAQSPFRNQAKNAGSVIAVRIKREAHRGSVEAIDALKVH